MKKLPVTIVPHALVFVRWLVPFAALGLVACQSATITPSFPPIPAPKFAIGDHWEYRITDNLRLGLVTILDANVVSIKDGTATVQLVFNNQNGRSEATEEIDANGGMIVGALKGQETRHFQTPIRLFDFPLEQRKTWRQTVATISPDTQLPAQILVFGTIQGETVVNGAGGRVQRDVRLPHHPARRRAVLAHAHDAGRFGVVFPGHESPGARASQCLFHPERGRHRQLCPNREHDARTGIFPARTEGSLVRIRDAQPESLPDDRRQLRLVQRVEVQPRSAVREKVRAQLGHDIEPESANRSRVVPEALHLASNPARYFGAARVGEARQF